MRKCRGAKGCLQYRGKRGAAPVPLEIAAEANRPVAPIASRICRCSFQVLWFSVLSNCGPSASDAARGRAAEPRGTRLRRARSLAEANWTAATQGGFLRFWIDTLTLLAALEGRMGTAARMRGFADVAYATNHEKRRIGEFRTTEQAVALTRAALGSDRFDALHAQGAAMAEARIAEIVLATEDSAAA
jgi:hypothetical protein